MVVVSNASQRILYCNQATMLEENMIPHWLGGTMIYTRYDHGVNQKKQSAYRPDVMYLGERRGQIFVSRQLANILIAVRQRS